MSVVEKSAGLGPAGLRPQQVAAEERRMVPVKWWAAAGALWTAFMAWVLIRWVTGPFFEQVPAGPSEQPGWMEAFLTVFQLISIPLALFCLYWFAVRPWVRERRLTTDGVLVIAFATLWWQDPISAYGGHWFTYNANLVNFGSWTASVPGWGSFAAPGEMVVEPILLIPGLYVWVFVITMLMGCWVMRKAKARWPQIGKLGLIGICFATMCAFDIVFEGLIFMPLGAWEYPGGHLSIFPSTYHKYPLHEMLTVSATFAAVASIRYFVNDRGETVAERGIDRVRHGTGAKNAIRAFAVIAAVHVALFVTYNVPNFWIGLHSNEWPADLQKRSYFTNGICGDGTDRACPGPGVPLPRNDNDDVGSSSYASPDGRLVIPESTELPEPVPFDRGELGGGR